MFDLVYKTLAPGGKLVLCKTVIKNEALAKESKIEGINDLIHLDLLKPLLENAGFKNVIVDMGNSKMIYEHAQNLNMNVFMNMNMSKNKK